MGTLLQFPLLLAHQDTRARLEISALLLSANEAEFVRLGAILTDAALLHAKLSAERAARAEREAS